MNLRKLTFGAAGDLVGKYVFMDFIKCGLCKHTLEDCQEHWVAGVWHKGDFKGANCSVVRCLRKRTCGYSFRLGGCRSQTGRQAEEPPGESHQNAEQGGGHSLGGDVSQQT